MICRVALQSVCKISVPIEGINNDDYTGYDAVYKSAETVKSANNGPLKYLVFSRNDIVPEFFIEYSMESDWDRLTTQLEKLLVDIAYSNRLSHADMPNIVHELSLKITESDVNCK